VKERAVNYRVREGTGTAILKSTATDGDWHDEHTIDLSVRFRIRYGILVANYYDILYPVDLFLFVLFCPSSPPSLSPRDVLPNV
jgi:hypothetical protein